MTCCDMLDEQMDWFGMEKLICGDGLTNTVMLVFWPGHPLPEVEIEYETE